MYHGEVKVAQEDLNSFLAVAEELEVKGLTNGDQRDVAKRTLESQTSFETTNKRTPTPKLGKEGTYEYAKKTQEVHIKSEESFIDDVTENELMTQNEYMDEPCSEYMDYHKDYEEQTYQFTEPVYGQESRVRRHGKQEQNQ